MSNGSNSAPYLGDKEKVTSGNLGPTYGGQIIGGTDGQCPGGVSAQSTLIFNSPQTRSPRALAPDDYVCLETEWFVLRSPEGSAIEVSIRHRCSEFDGLGGSSGILQLNPKFWDEKMYICEVCHKLIPDNIKAAAGLAGL